MAFPALRVRWPLVVLFYSWSVAIVACGAKTDIDDALATSSTGVRPGPTATSTVRPNPTTGPTTSPTGAPTSTSPPRPDGGPLVCSNVTGRWVGTWTTRSGISGTWSTDMREDASGNIQGTSSVSGTSCGSSSSVVGRRTGCQISFGFVGLATCSVSFDGNIHNDGMWGAFKVTMGVSDTGTWEGVRVR